MGSSLLTFISLSILQIVFLFQEVNSKPVKRAMCASPNPELASIDDTCHDSSQCVTAHCQDGRCACPSNHYYDDCQHTCQAENDEESQITAMKAGTTAIGTFILIVVLVIIMVREKRIDNDSNKKKKKKKVGDVSKNQSKNPLTKIPEEKPKQSQADRKLVQGHEHNGKVVSSKISATTANKPVSSSKDNHIYDNDVFTISVDKHIYNTVYDNVAFSGSTPEPNRKIKEDRYEMSTKL